MDPASQSVLALLPLAGVIVGAGLQHYFSRSAERLKQVDILRTQAYVDYLRVVAKFAQLAKSSPVERVSLFGEAADAKTRICIYGSRRAIELLAEFERKGANLSSPDAMQTFVSLCSQMRSEGVVVREPVLEKDIELVLFGPQT